MNVFEYKDYPPLPDWLTTHLYRILADQSSKPTEYDDNFKERMLEEADMWMGGADQKTLDAIAYLDYNEQDTLGKPFTEADAFKPFEQSLARFDFIPVDKIVEDWVKDNIPEKVIGVNLQVMHSGEIITPHIDELRHSALNYTLDKGGDDIRTVFYKIKPEWSHQKAYARTLIPFEKLEVLESIPIQACRWHKIDTEIIHGVTGLDPKRKRIALSCSIVR